MKLTHAEIIVKRIMLKHPLISESRLAVLSQIFLRDPDAAWGEDGRIHVYNIKETLQRLRYSDNDEGDHEAHRANETIRVINKKLALKV